MRAVILAVLLAWAAFGSAIAAGNRDHSASAASAFGKTGKERLSDKGSDEQRVDDCKVPVSKRTRARPTACPWEVQTSTGEPSIAAPSSLGPVSADLTPGFGLNPRATQ